jgi:hypothetical protein
VLPTHRPAIAATTNGMLPLSATAMHARLRGVPQMLTQQRTVRARKPRPARKFSRGDVARRGAACMAQLAESSAPV